MMNFGSPQLMSYKRHKQTPTQMGIGERLVAPPSSSWVAKLALSVANEEKPKEARETCWVGYDAPRQRLSPGYDVRLASRHRFLSENVEREGA
ncbi:unnamed protein product [Nippostrongylus brasiliensis]|uniref:Uncharacterized protein n=1 Tax=Nippostrongylus brasiliensis TaxID=27835 RepID=A0A0N4Y5V4_NIPBR|nr:hypothetical protein Q1695_005779 [Nippostrongylus brasiliensis]VDL74998.1 unnamed protein product [Nippostrongylus brasiliensis]